MPSFYKFPSTPHLAILGNNDVRGDKCLTFQERNQFLAHKIVVEEKIDGANLGISFNKSKELTCQNRGSILMPPLTGQWKKLQNWLNPKIDLLFGTLEDRLILFGEWCYARHSVYYNHLPDWFIAFDVYDKQTGRFFSVNRRDLLVASLGIAYVPQITNGCFSYDELKKLTFQSHFGQQNAEGIYLRIDNENWLSERAKLVRPTFLKAIENHWSRITIHPNQVTRNYI